MDARFAAVADIAHQNGTPFSFEAARWSDADLEIREAMLEHDRERCPGCSLHPDAAAYVTAVADHCPMCATRDQKRGTLQKQEDTDGWHVRWQVLHGDDAAEHSAWATNTAEGALARRRALEQRIADAEPDDG